MKRLLFALLILASGMQCLKISSQKCLEHYYEKKGAQPKNNPRFINEFVINIKR